MSTDITPETPAAPPQPAATVRWGSVVLFILFGFAISWALWLVIVFALWLAATGRLRAIPDQPAM